MCTLNFCKKDHRKVETGYWIFTEYWGRGIVPEALSKIFDYGFTEMNLHRISAEVEDNNKASIAGLKKAGFEYEGTLRECEIKDVRFINLQIYALLKKKAGNYAGCTIFYNPFVQLCKWALVTKAFFK